MIEKIEILQHGEGSLFGFLPGEEAFWLLCIVAYHHELVVQLREDRLDSLSEALVSSRWLSPVFLVKPVRHFIIIDMHNFVVKFGHGQHIIKSIVVL